MTSVTWTKTEIMTSPEKSSWVQPPEKEKGTEKEKNRREERKKKKIFIAVFL